MSFTKFEKFLNRKIPDDYWKDKENIILFMRFVCYTNKYKEIEDWYNCAKTNIIKLGGGKLFIKFNDVIEILNFIYENNYTFYFWKLNIVPKGSWDDLNKQKEYMNWIYNKLEFKSMEDWYNLTYQQIYKNYGYTLTERYKNYPYGILKNIYPDYDWKPWKFNMVSSKLWEIKEILDKYRDYLSKTMNINKIEDWYNINQEIIFKNDGSGLIKKAGSLINLLKIFYPDYVWLEWKLKKTENFWVNIDNQRKYMDWLFKELKYETMEDWYKTSILIFNKNRGCGILKRYENSPKKLITSVYNDYQWDDKKFYEHKCERICNNLLLELDENLIYGFKSDWCRNESTNKHLPFDICSPKYKIILEIDGPQHFKVIKEWDNDPEETRKRDKYKMEKALENGYSIIRILQEDIYYDKNSWKDKLINSIKMYEEPQIIYLNEIYKDYY